MNHLSVEQILEHIANSKQFEQMRETRDRVHEMLHEHLLFSHSLDLHRNLNKIHDAFIRKVIECSEQIMEAQGFGKPPVQYAFVLFGSGGRSEQTLWSDQDNGFIYEDSKLFPPEELASYFAKFIDCILSGLAILGYPPCQGNVVSSNEQWRKPLSHYKEMMLQWFDDPSWENVRYLLIMADMRCISGDNGLVEQLKGEFLNYVKEHPAILRYLLSNTLHHKVSMGVFGQLITERYGEDAGGFDIKYGAYIPIVNGIRMMAIQAGIHSSSTLERLRLLEDHHLVDEQHASEWRQGFTIALKLRDMTPYQMEDGLYTTRGKLTADQLTKECKQELKSCLRAGADLQKYVRRYIEAQIEKEKG